MPPKAAAADTKSPSIVYLRDGEVVLYKRGASARWQARFKLNDAKWHRVSTGHRNAEYAGKAATEAYDRARFLRAENIPVVSKRFDAIAKITLDELNGQLQAGVGKVVYHTYIQAITAYLIPFFGRYAINTIGYKELKEFDAWRTKKLGRVPAASTVTNHTSSLNRVFDTALERGYIHKQQIPVMKNNGKKGTAREAFSLSEYKSLTGFMPSWVTRINKPKSVEMRELLRDYVLVLSNSGMRHGTEAMGLRWCDIEWIKSDGERYIQFTVKGKIGKRTLINRHATEDYLKRIQSRFPELAKMDFDKLLKSKCQDKVFRLRSGEETKSLPGTFRQLMRDSGLDKDKPVKERRSLYSLRHTYAHFSILNDAMDVYTLAEQMGTSVKMIEQHYGHLKPAQKARQIAGRRFVRA